MTNGIAIKQPTLAVELGQRQPQFRAALPAHIPVERFVRVVLTAIQTSPKLAQMDRASLWNACMRAAQDGLLPDGREGALVPFKGKVTWIPMVGGIRKKVRNSEAIATWDVHAVHAKDQFQFELGDDPYIKHKPFMPKPLERSGAETDEQYRARLRAHIGPGPLIAVYSVAVLKTGEKSRDMMTRADVELVRDTYARKDDDGKFSPMWRNSFDEAAKKTLARRHAKVLPMSTDLDDILRRDDELYDLKGASDKVLAGPRPKSLSARIDALAGLEDTPHYPETGEVIDQVSGERFPETTADESVAAGARDAGQRRPLPPGSGDQAGRPASATPPPDDSLPDDNAALDRGALLQDLMQTGERIARERGPRALDLWLDEDLNGDELAVLTAGHTRRLKQIAAEAKSARA